MTDQGKTPGKRSSSSEGSAAKKTKETVESVSPSRLSPCSRCTVLLEDNDAIYMEKCIHVLCRECLTELVESAHGKDIRCPCGESEACSGFVSHGAMKQFLSSELYEKYLGESLSAFTHDDEDIVITCLSPTCSYVALLDETGDPPRVFVCPLCNTMNCIPCKAVHEDISCERYQEFLDECKGMSGEEQDKAFKNELGKSGVGQFFTTFQGFMTDNGTTADVFELMELMSVVSTTTPFECPICAEDVNEGIVLLDCLHNICNNCIKNVVKHSDEPEIKCPLNNPFDKNSCQAVIQQKELRAILPNNEFESFLRRSIDTAEKLTEDKFHCVTPDCRGWCEVAGPDAMFFECPICEARNCIQCEAQHVGTCDQFKNKIDVVQNLKDEEKGRKAMEKLVEKRLAQKCPKCGVLCQKISGCNNVTCASCQKHFIWTVKTAKK